MRNAVFVVPFFMEATLRFVSGAASLPGVRLGVVSQDPAERMPEELRARIAAHWRVDDALDPRHIAAGVEGITRQIGRIERLVGSLEQLQVPLAQVREHLGLPGLSVAVVKDGRVAHAKGYGVRRVGEAAAVDADTLFGIASNTKAMTCAAISMLADEGRLDWDDPVTKHLPDFQMYDPWVTREVTLRDLVTHRAGLGLGQGDLMWWPATDFTRREIVRGIRHLKPATSFRSTSSTLARLGASRSMKTMPTDRIHRPTRGMRPNVRRATNQQRRGIDTPTSTGSRWLAWLLTRTVGPCAGTRDAPSMRSRSHSLQPHQQTAQLR